MGQPTQVTMQVLFIYILIYSLIAMHLKEIQQ